MFRLHAARARCILRGSRALRIGSCLLQFTLRIPAASRDSRCMLPVASFVLRVARRRYVRVAANGGAPAHARQLFQTSGTPPPVSAPLRAHTCPLAGSGPLDWFGPAAARCGRVPPPLLSVACCMEALHVASFRPRGARSGSHVACSGCTLHARVASCAALVPCA